MPNWMSKLLPYLTGVMTIGAGVNAGAVFGAIQTQQGSNVALYLNLIASLLASLGLGGWTAYSKGGKPSAPSYRKGIDLVEDLAEHCKDCRESQEALQVIASNLTKRLIKP